MNQQEISEETIKIRKGETQLLWEGDHWSDTDREVLQREYYNGTSYNEIAIMLLRSESAIHQQVERMGLCTRNPFSTRKKSADTDAYSCLCKNCKMADAFMARVQAGSYDLTGNAKTIAALEAIADRVSFRAPTPAMGNILPYSVSVQASGGGSFDTAGLLEQLRSISEKSERQLELMNDMVMLMDQMQFVADFGNNIRALARKITKEQRRDKISEGR